MNINDVFIFVYLLGLSRTKDLRRFACWTQADSQPMAAISRRRRFLTVFITLCMFCAIFAWYTQKEDLKSLNDVLVTEFITVPHKDSTQGKRVPYTNHHSDSSRLDFPDSRNLLGKKLVEDNELPNDIQYQEEDSKLGDSGLQKNPSKPKLIKIISRKKGVIIHGVKSSAEKSSHLSATTESGTTQLGPSGPTVDVVSTVAKLTSLPVSGPTKSISIVHKTTPIPKSTKEFGSTTPNLSQVIKHDAQAGLLIDTPGCKIPKHNPWDSTVANLIELQEPLKCPGLPLIMKSHADGSIHLNITVLYDSYNLTAEELTCTYQSIKRKHEEEGNVRENDYILGDDTPMKFGVPLEEDYVVVRCNMGSKIFEQYFPLVRIRKELEEERTKITPPTPRLNVILAGIDSVSKLNFLRHFSRTKKFLTEKMSPFEMNGYTKVGDNTFPNLVPLLTGHFVEYYWNESIRDTFYFDSLDLIWKDYAKKGYRTFYAEDSPHTGTFNYIKRGFYDPPTDYYLRPVALALESSDVRKNSASHCLNSQIETDFIYDYLRDFVEGMDTRPYIAFAMVSTLTHDYLNNAGLADEPAARMLEDLWNKGVFNNSALVLFSDHGLRFGAIRQTYIGKFEERMPFMYIHFPKWFLDQNPEIAKNMKTNQDRLITLFDIHATMMHLLDISRNITPEEEAKITQGRSLLNEISPNRTCEEANILSHWCPCQTFEVVPLDDISAIKSTHAIVNDINNKLQPYGNACAVLEIEKVLDVRLGQANDLVLRFVRHDNVVVNRTVVLGERMEPIGDYLVTLITKPGQAVFEATVRHDPNHDTYDVLGISRINMYGNQSWCIESQKLKIFCYCTS